MEHGPTIQRMMEHNRAIRRTSYIRVITVIVLMVTWTVVAAVGIFLMAGPWGDEPDLQVRSRLLVLGLNREAWGEIHMQLGFLAVLAAVVHIAIEWRSFRGYLRHLTSRQAIPNLPGSQHVHIPGPPGSRSGDPKERTPE